jgi:pilus assembly protein Flp/PilA
MSPSPLPKTAGTENSAPLPSVYFLGVEQHVPASEGLQAIQQLISGKAPMNDNLLKLGIKMRTLLKEDGQDLIEYALVVALIAFAATAGMSTLASAINNAFTSIGSTLSSYVA